jgi:hypothetical protein
MLKILNDARISPSLIRQNVDGEPCLFRRGPSQLAYSHSVTSLIHELHCRSLFIRYRKKCPEPALDQEKSGIEDKDGVAGGSSHRVFYQEKCG